MAKRRFRLFDDFNASDSDGERSTRHCSNYALLGSSGGTSAHMYRCDELWQTLAVGLRRADSAPPPLLLDAAAELDVSGFGRKLWRTLLSCLICDVGCADTHAIYQFSRHYQRWRNAVGSINSRSAEEPAARRELAQCVQLLAGAKKSNRVLYAAQWAVLGGDAMLVGAPQQDTKMSRMIYYRKNDVCAPHLERARQLLNILYIALENDAELDAVLCAALLGHMAATWTLPLAPNRRITRWARRNLVKQHAPTLSEWLDDHRFKHPLWAIVLVAVASLCLERNESVAVLVAVEHLVRLYRLLYNDLQLNNDAHVLFPVWCVQLYATRRTWMTTTVVGAADIVFPHPPSLVYESLGALGMNEELRLQRFRRVAVPTWALNKRTAYGRVGCSAATLERDYQHDSLMLETCATGLPPFEHTEFVQKTLIQRAADHGTCLYDLTSLAAPRDAVASVRP